MTFKRVIVVLSFILFPLTSQAKFGLVDCTETKPVPGPGEVGDMRYIPPQECFGNLKNSSGIMSQSDIQNLISQVKALPSLDWGAAIDPQASQGFELLKVVADTKLDLSAGLIERLKKYASTKSLLNKDQVKEKYVTYLEVMAEIEKKYPGKYLLFPGVEKEDSARYSRLKVFAADYELKFQTDSFQVSPVEAVAGACRWKRTPMVQFSKCEIKKSCVGEVECKGKNGLMIDYRVSCSADGGCGDATACMESDSGVGSSKSCVGIVEEKGHATEDKDVKNLLKQLNINQGAQ